MKFSLSIFDYTFTNYTDTLAKRRSTGGVSTTPAHHNTSYSKLYLGLAAPVLNVYQPRVFTHFLTQQVPGFGVSLVKNVAMQA